MYTHSECIQADRDVGFIEAVGPKYVFLDQRQANEHTAFSRLSVPMKWLGYGANPASFISPTKDIDILWIGNSFPARQPLVEKYIYPLASKSYDPAAGTGFNILFHGNGQRDGPLSLDEMFPVLARTKIVLNLNAYEIRPDVLGYGGRRILDCHASGAYVVSSRFATDRESFPHGTSFVEMDEIADEALRLLETGEYRAGAMRAYGFVRREWMIEHVILKMMELAGVTT
jgi:hypothetical protein